MPRKQDIAASAVDPLKTLLVKGSKNASEAGYCCLCRGPIENSLGQRQQKCLGSRILLLLPWTHRNLFWSKAAKMPQKQDIAASAMDPLKTLLVKGSKNASEAGYCCLCHGPIENSLGQRQQKCLGSRILLLLPWTHRNLFWSKAAKMPQKQDIAASAMDPLKTLLVKGSKNASEAGYCCLCRGPIEISFGQRQQKCLRSRILLPLPWTH